MSWKEVVYCNVVVFAAAAACLPGPPSPLRTGLWRGAGPYNPFFSLIVTLQKIFSYNNAFKRPVWGSIVPWTQLISCSTWTTKVRKIREEEALKPHSIFFIQRVITRNQYSEEFNSIVNFQKATLKIARWRLLIFISILPIIADFLTVKVSLISDFFEATSDYLWKETFSTIFKHCAFFGSFWCCTKTFILGTYLASTKLKVAGISSCDSYTCPKWPKIVFTDSPVKCRLEFFEFVVRCGPPSKGCWSRRSELFWL